MWLRKITKSRARKTIVVLILTCFLFWLFTTLNAESAVKTTSLSHSLPRLVIGASSAPADSVSKSLKGSHNSKEQWECTPHDNVQILFYNRIAKCASTSFVNLLQRLASRAQFQLIFNHKGAYDWSIQDIVGVAIKIKASAHEGKRVAYAQHFYYTDYTPHLTLNYSYVTLVRDPIDRLISSYYYYHYSTKKYIQKMLPSERRNETLLDCIRYSHEGCTHNLLTKYFCGHSELCSNGSSQALETAKYNLKHKFVAVGLVENLTQSVQLFQKLLPAFFPPMSLDDINKILPYTNQYKRTGEVSNLVIKIIQMRNQADIELYQFAKKLFLDKITKCNKLVL
ncbi:heparan sulfate 2-O-sulfotransferase 1-like [Dysidea avara]|uniref:heparan sulfate 2-O-sulfotransferase 1-like n=1 Tax=Dysidea avara TaxID=196820 RepID=UPI00331F6F29